MPVGRILPKRDAITALAPTHLYLLDFGLQEAQLVFTCIAVTSKWILHDLTAMALDKRLDKMEPQAGLNVRAS